MSTYPTPPVEKPNRREFLYYLGGASLALLGAGSVGVLTRFLNPPLRGEKDGIFQVSLTDIPKQGSVFLYRAHSLYYLSQDEGGLLALESHCTFSKDRTILLRWVPTNQRFECPSCGSKFRSDGTYIEGIAGRFMDRFVVEVTTPNGIIATPPDGSPVSIEGATQIMVDTNRAIYGQQRT
jgi:cytochrome b6-f complex iron-sulfur subunit